MKDEQTKLILYFIFSVLFIIVTTNYLDDLDLINQFGQKDIEQYYIIAKEVPKLPFNNEEILPHVSSRYIVPYIIGSISNAFELDLFITYRIITFFFLLLFLLFFYKFLQTSFSNFWEKILFFSVIFFNPYIIRHHVFQPVQAHDLLFFTLTIIFLTGINKNNYKYIFISALLMIFIRQTSIAFLIGGSVFFFLNKDYKKMATLILLFLLLFKLNSLVGASISIGKFNMNYAIGIFSYDFSNWEKLLRFLLLPFISFFPIILLMIYSMRINDSVNLNMVITCFVVSILMIGQPILGGPDYTQRNVIRISTLSYILATFFVFSLFNLEKLYKKKLLLVIFIAGLFLWSFHPLYSNVKFFSILRF